jgi:predicted O-methyltransferase YrrM
MVKDMDAWASGYVTDLEYANGFYKEQSPTHLRLICLLCGVETAPIDAGFTYCELGCGTGITSLVLAAANPEARFVAVDFNPAHIVYAREMARASGLSNIEFHEAAFDDLVNGRGPTMPAFDFITLHGVYSWVAPSVRASIVQLIEKTLKPGGIAYVSYNAMRLGIVHPCSGCCSMSPSKAGSGRRGDAPRRWPVVKAEGRRCGGAEEQRLRQGDPQVHDGRSSVPGPRISERELGAAISHRCGS